MTAHRKMDDIEKLRIGAVSYLNTVPLIQGLTELLPLARLVFDHPSRLADGLAEGRLDVGLVPSIELARHPEWTVVSSACIAARGPVLSVKLLFRRPPAEVQTLALDEGSRTSAVLAQILLADIHGIRPRQVSLPVDRSPSDIEADAVLVIGDRAIRQPEADFVEAWDLGDRWSRWTELPFVFAAWAARPGVDVAELEPALDAARDQGCRDLEAISAEQAAGMELPRDLVLAYLRDHLHFKLGAGELRGLNLYFRRAASLGLIPRAPRFDVHDRHATR
jgi:chorismate dehydratase